MSSVNAEAKEASENALLWKFLFLGVTPAAVAFAAFTGYMLRPIPQERASETPPQNQPVPAQAAVAEARHGDGKAWREQAATAPLHRDIAEENDPLARLYKRLRPGTPLREFAKRMEAEVANAGWQWTCPLVSITGPDFLTTLHFDSSVTGVGKLVSELHVMESPWQNVDCSATLSFCAAWKPSAARANRDRRILQMARALRLTHEEMRRLRAVLGTVPMPYSEKALCEVAANQLVSKLPRRARRKFVDTWTVFQAWEAYEENPARHPEPAAVMGGLGPAIGFPLSDRLVADVGFCLFDPLVIYKGPQLYELGEWWTISLWPRKDTSETSPVQTEKSNRMTFKHWPRLTRGEVDSLGE